MYDSHKTILIPDKALTVYKVFLFLYPKQYRKRFGLQMLYTFQDLYQEEIHKNKHINGRFWILLLLDILQSTCEQQKDVIQKNGMRNYIQQTLHINRYNIIGSILLLPFITLMAMDLIGRIVQGDLFHYNKSFYAFISHTFIYASYNGKSPFLWTALIFFPILAILTNIVPLLFTLQKKGTKKRTISIITSNTPAFLVLGIGLFCLFMIYGHDIIPCTIHGILRKGFTDFFNILNYCRLNA